MTIFQNPTFTLVNGGVNFVVDISILPDPEVFLYFYTIIIGEHHYMTGLSEKKVLLTSV